MGNMPYVALAPTLDEKNFPPSSDDDKPDLIIIHRSSRDVPVSMPSTLKTPTSAATASSSGLVAAIVIEASIEAVQEDPPQLRMLMSDAARELFRLASHHDLPVKVDGVPLKLLTSSSHNVKYVRKKVRCLQVGHENCAKHMNCNMSGTFGQLELLASQCRPIPRPMESRQLCPERGGNPPVP